MVSDGLALTYNGELYNAPRAACRAGGRRGALPRHAPTPRCCWRPGGAGAPDCLPRLRGMFAFGIFDERTGELVLARDQLGIKPLFLLRRGEGLVVRLRAEGARRRARAGRWRSTHAALVASLLYYWVPGLTVRATARREKLPPGSWLQVPARRPGGARPVLVPEGRRRRGPGAGRPASSRTSPPSSRSRPAAT